MMRQKLRGRCQFVRVVDQRANIGALSPARCGITKASDKAWRIGEASIREQARHELRLDLADPARSRRAS
jgi:hypothetical protein